MCPYEIWGLELHMAYNVVLHYFTVTLLTTVSIGILIKTIV